MVGTVPADGTWVGKLRCAGRGDETVGDETIERTRLAGRHEACDCRAAVGHGHFASGANRVEIPAEVIA